MKKVWLGLFVVVAAYACGDTASQMMGGALEDAGTMLQDAGEQMQDGGAQAQQSKNVPCDREATNAGNPWFKYALVDVGGAKFPNVTVRTVVPSFKANWCPTSDCSGFPAGKYVAEYHASSFTADGKVFINCSGNEESITVFY